MTKMSKISSIQVKERGQTSWLAALFVIISALIAFYIRIRPRDSVFLENGFIRFSNDPLYHMRIVEVLLHNYPHGMFYNPLTNYPNGAYIHFGPLFDHMIALTALILGLGNPDTPLVNIIGAYFPTVLGALTVIPVYYIGKYLKDRKTGVIAAFLIAIAPGQFLSRSTIIFTDHHVAETLFSSLLMLFFLIALIEAKKRNLSLKMLQNKNKEATRPIIFAILAGLMYAAYQLTWPGAPMFGMIIVIFAAVQYTVDHLNNRSTEYLGIIGVITFIVGLLPVVPFINPDMGFSAYIYSWFHVATAFAAIFAFLYMSIVHKVLNDKRLRTAYYPIVLIATLMIGLLAMRMIAPSIFGSIAGISATIFSAKTGGFNTIGEVSSIFYHGGVFTLSSVWYNFATGFFLSLIAMVMLALSIWKDKKPEELLILVWAFIMLLAIYGQNRFAYYYSINVVVLSGYFAAKVLDMTGWKKIEDACYDKMNSIRELPGCLSKNIRIIHVLTILLLLLLVAYPSYGLAMQQSQYTSGANDYWLEALFWMEANTPDPGIDFLKIYDAPEKGKLFDYPDTVYGVMSWWDYGHEIETIARRLPNANPFQQGIGGRRNSIEEENKPGASTFFTAPSEEEATAVLEAIHPDPDKMGARYIVSDVEMATGKFYAMASWTLDTDNYYTAVQTDQGVVTVPYERYFNSMEAKLHIFDGNGLKHYRMVHESPGTSTQGQEIGYKNVYNVLLGGNIKEDNTGYVKIFEYVEGATITGTAPAGESVTISTTISTSQGRSFTYSQTATSNGTYAFTVPYSTEGPVSGQTQFDVSPTKPYQISYDSVVEEVKVTETDVLQGNTIEV